LTISFDGKVMKVASPLFRAPQGRFIKPAKADFINSSQRGGALLEFAIIAPLLLIILFGIVEFGLILYNKALLTNASREGARYGIVSSNSTASIPDVVINYCKGQNGSYKLITFGTQTNPSVLVSSSADETTPDNPNLEVEVTWPYGFLAFPVLSGLGVVNDGLMLSGRTVMKYE
jgi:Flp pilus assembly protein TadG